MPLSKSDIKSLRARGHSLNPVVMVADKGLHEGVLNELDRAFEDHELIKVKLAIADREARKAIAHDLAKQCKAELLQEIGKVALYYRESEKLRKK